MEACKTNDSGELILNAENLLKKLSDDAKGFAAFSAFQIIYGVIETVANRRLYEILIILRVFMSSRRKVNINTLGMAPPNLNRRCSVYMSVLISSLSSQCVFD